MGFLIQPLIAIAFALPCFSMAARLWRVWREPMAIEDGRWVRLGTGVFVLEFVLLHAGVFLGSVGAGVETVAAKVGMTLGVAAFYGIFAGAIALGFKSRMLFDAFLWLILGRLAAVVVGAPPAGMVPGARPRTGAGGDPRDGTPTAATRPRTWARRAGAAGAARPAPLT
jgi:hypothetical protein